MTPTTTIQINGQLRDAATTLHPADRDFRNAWQISGSVIDVDMVKAKELHKAKIRADRMVAFDPFDKVAVPLTRKAARGQALTAEEVAALTAAEAAAQKLRDAPDDARIANATTPDELKVLTLDVLTA